MNRARDVARSYALDALILLAAVEGALEVAVLRRDAADAPRTTLWFCVPAIVLVASVFVVGAIAAFLLGNLPDSFQARIGLAVVLGAAAIITYNDPSHEPGEFIFTPALFAIAWLAGFALRERATRAEAAEARATFAEREREAAARVAVAEERARIARELHDIVAHAVSVMVLQVGAVRHKLPAALEEDGDALQRVEQAGRTALSVMRQLLAAMR